MQSAPIYIRRRRLPCATGDDTLPFMHRAKGQLHGRPETEKISAREGHHGERPAKCVDLVKVLPPPEATPVATIAVCLANGVAVHMRKMILLGLSSSWCILGSQRVQQINSQQRHAYSCEVIRQLAKASCMGVVSLIPGGCSRPPLDAESEFYWVQNNRPS